MIRILVIALSVAATACTTAPTSPSASSSVAGTWTGTSSGPGFTGAPARLVLTEQAVNLVGTLSAKLGAFDIVDGAVSGLSAPGFAGLTYFPPTQLTCADGSKLLLSIIVQLLQSGNRLTGTYSYTGCTGPVGGDMALTRQ